jgi:peptidyl-prolyl cis-trans isomerase-like protein 2
VCTPQGTVFELTRIVPWLKAHGNTNPVDGSPLARTDLIPLRFARSNDAAAASGAHIVNSSSSGYSSNGSTDYVDPVTFKPLTDHTHIVALRPTGNVFAYDTVQRLNVRAKLWRDLVSDVPFARADIITLQDPHNLAGRDLSGFRYLRDGVKPPPASPAAAAAAAAAATAGGEGNSGGSGGGGGRSAEVDGGETKTTLTTTARAQASAAQSGVAQATAAQSSSSLSSSSSSSFKKPAVPYNAALHTTGKAAASFTSTGLTPHTAGERALLTDEEYMLRPRRVRHAGYARLDTSLGALHVELHTQWAPRAVWNFVQLAKRGYYRRVPFHRSIRNFMARIISFSLSLSLPLPKIKNQAFSFFFLFIFMLQLVLLFVQFILLARERFLPFL